MERNFASVLSTLRKDAGISQREAAESLGISQALLSHYENGIRECKLDFLVKAADFYNVTTDYLLGRSESKQGFTGAFNINEDIKSDNMLSTLTIFRAASRIRENLAAYQDDSLLDDVHRMYSVMLYRIILAEVRNGNLPQAWIPNMDKIDNEVYTDLLYGIESRLLEKNRTSSGADESDTPQCVKTMVKYIQNYVREQCAEAGVELPDSFVG